MAYYGLQNLLALLLFWSPVLVTSVCMKGFVASCCMLVLRESLGYLVGSFGSRGGSVVPRELQGSAGQFGVRQ